MSFFKGCNVLPLFNLYQSFVGFIFQFFLIVSYFEF